LRLAGIFPGEQRLPAAKRTLKDDSCSLALDLIRLFYASGEQSLHMGSFFPC
jgi:hypothetical protein